MSVTNLTNLTIVTNVTIVTNLTITTKCDQCQIGFELLTYNMIEKLSSPAEKISRVLNRELCSTTHQSFLISSIETSTYLKSKRHQHQRVILSFFSKSNFEPSKSSR